MKFNYKFFPHITAGILVLLLFLAGGYFYYQNQKTQVAKANPQIQAQEEVKKVVAEVGKLIDLPADETPTVATVTDITKLKDQPFFAKAKNGDKVLIYTNSKKAILYDPIAKKVIDVAPINIGTSSAQTSQPKVALKNGTTTVGLTTRVETELKKTIPLLNVVTKENAQKNDYEKTTVVVIKPFGKDTAAAIAKALNTTIGTLPAGEVVSKDADVVVILGKDATKLVLGH